MDEQPTYSLTDVREIVEYEDRLRQIFEMRQQFMDALHDQADSERQYPLDLSEKDSQRHLRDVSLRGVEEVFEALGLLKNWKPHRKTEVPTFDRDKFLEEWIDAFNYFFTVLIMAGFTPDDVFDMYVKKDKIIHERLKNGY